MCVATIPQRHGQTTCRSNVYTLPSIVQ